MTIKDLQNLIEKYKIAPDTELAIITKEGDAIALKGCTRQRNEHGPDQVTFVPTLGLNIES